MAIEVASDAIAVMDEAGASIYHNSAFEELLGFGEAEVLGRTS